MSFYYLMEKRVLVKTCSRKKRELLVAEGFKQIADSTGWNNNINIARGV